MSKQGLEAYESQYRERKVKAMARQAQGLGLHAGGPGHTRGAEPRRGRRTDPLSWHNTTPVSHPLWGKGGSVFTRQHSARRKTRYHTPRLPLTPPHPPPSPFLG